MDRWYLSRPRWERILMLFLGVWAFIVPLLYLGDYDERGHVAIIMGPGLALAVYFFCRFAALAFRRTS